MRAIEQTACPVAGMQAPSFAAGQHFALMDEALATANANLLMDIHVSSCDEVSRTLIMSDFARCRQQIRLLLTLRLSWWRALPWILFGVAHHSVEVAVACAIRALQLFDASPNGTAHHTITLLLCCKDTICGMQLRLFAAGERTLDQLPALHFQIARLRFAPTSERYVEGLHAILKRSIALAHRSSAVYVAFHAIQKQLRNQLLSNPGMLQKLAELCLQCRNATYCIRRMGMWTHPAVRQIRAMSKNRSDLNRHLAPLLVDVLYHVDQHTLLGDLPQDSSDSVDVAGDAGDDDGNDGPGGGGQGSGGDLGAQDAAAHGSVDNGDDNDDGNDGGSAGGLGGADDGGGNAVVADDGGGAKLGRRQDQASDASRALKSGHGGLHDALVCKEAAAFLRSEAKKRTLYLSLGPKLCLGVTDYVSALREHVQDQKQIEDGFNVRSSMEKDEPKYPLATSEFMTRVLLFTVNRAELAKVVVPRGAPRPDTSSIAVTPQNIFAFDDVSRTVRVHLEGEGGQGLDQCVLSSQMLTTYDLFTLRVWTEERLEIHFETASAVEYCEGAQEVISDLIESHGLNRGFTVFVADDPDMKKHDILQKLRDEYLATVTASDSEWSVWSFTPLALQKLRTVQVLTSARRFLAVPDGLKVEDASTYHLSQMLHADGWTCMVRFRPRSKKKAAFECEANPQVAYVVGGPKHWWLAPTQTKLKRQYMTCLLRASDLRKPIPHGKTEEEYTCMLAGEEYHPQRKFRIISEAGARLPATKTCAQNGRRARGTCFRRCP